MSTIRAIQIGFGGSLAAFAYLLFILLYMPCVATIGVVYKEIGTFWAIFSTVWSVAVAYAVSVCVYQFGVFGEDPSGASIRIGIALLIAAVAFIGLIRWGRARQARLIPVQQI